MDVDAEMICSMEVEGLSGAGAAEEASASLAEGEDAPPAPAPNAPTVRDGTTTCQHENVLHTQTYIILATRPGISRESASAWQATR